MVVPAPVFAPPTNKYMLRWCSGSWLGRAPRGSPPLVQQRGRAGVGAGTAGAGGGPKLEVAARLQVHIETGEWRHHSNSVFRSDTSLLNVSTLGVSNVTNEMSFLQGPEMARPCLLHLLPDELSSQPSALRRVRPSLLFKCLESGGR